MKKEKTREWATRSVEWPDQRGDRPGLVGERMGNPSSMDHVTFLTLMDMRCHDPP